MTTIVYLGDDKTVSVADPGMTVLDISIAHKIPPTTRTRGSGRPLRDDQWAAQTRTQTRTQLILEGSSDAEGSRHLFELRAVLVNQNDEGLTKTYNRFHDPQETAEDIRLLRVLHRENDEAVAKAYGWDDLDLGHGFHETKQGLRYTISEEARREVLGRLLKLNHERYAEEVAMGLHEKGAKKGKGRRSGGKGNDRGKGQGRFGEQGELVFE